MGAITAFIAFYTGAAGLYSPDASYVPPLIRYNPRARTPPASSFPDQTGKSTDIICFHQGISSCLLAIYRNARTFELEYGREGEHWKGYLFSYNDWEGIQCAVVFLRFSNVSCWYSRGLL